MSGWCLALCVVLGVASMAGAAASAEPRRFDGFKALVVEPENSWTWDSAIFGALEERGFRVDFGAVPTEPQALARYDLVALSIKRYLAPQESAALQRYVADGGAVYGGWGGPMASPQFLQEVCRVRSTRSLRLREIRLLQTPLTAGITDATIALRERLGHMQAGQRGWEIVAVEPLPGGTPVAQDAEGNALGVLSQYGRGRAAVLGFGPEQEEHFARPEIGPAMLDNLLAWLLESGLSAPDRGWSGRVTVALPARAEVRDVYLNGERLTDPVISRVGSLRKVEFDVARVGDGQEATIRIAYDPLPSARNVETVIHLPWNTLRAAAAAPARLAEYLQSLNATTCQPLLRGSFGEAWYRGMPQDQHDAVLVKDCQGDFLADLIRECHQRGIKVVGGIYFDNAEPVRAHPEAQRLDRHGNAVKDRYGRGLACFNNPKGQEHSLATIRHLIENYELDGVTLDDNFELDKEECFCSYCMEAFRTYCEASGVQYRDPAQGWDASLAAHWREHRRQATRSLAANVRQVAAARGVPAGGWVGAGMDSTHLRGSFDFLGGMVYTEPPRAARGPLSVLGECGFICLLWAPGTEPQKMQQQAREAVRAGCAAVGFWIRGEDGGYAMDPARSEAIRQALGTTEAEWLAFYRDSILTGDSRFVLLNAKVARDETVLRLKNTGAIAASRVQGQVDVSALE